VTHVAASTLDRGRLAELFTAGYEGYPVPVRLDEAALDFMVDASSIDLARSRVALRGDEPVGVAFLAVRGDRGWIGGLAVVPSARRHGVGRALMDDVLAEAWAAGLREVSLEVLAGNERAFRLYETLGFAQTRMLEVWSWGGEAPASRARPADIAQSHEWIRAHRTAPEPWQRDDPSLVRMSPTHAFRTDGGAVLVRSGNGRASVLQIAADTVDDAADLLAAARELGVVHLVNLPEGDPASAALARLGGALDLRQHELALGRVSACSTM
jgi:ribosomal protein S18 acetylase RimI-like enzyme